MDTHLRFDDDDTALIRQAAKLAALPVSAWIKSTAVQAARSALPATKPAKLSKPPLGTKENPAHALPMSSGYDRNQSPVAPWERERQERIVAGRLIVHPHPDCFVPNGPGIRFTCDTLTEVFMTADDWLNQFPDCTLSTS